MTEPANRFTAMFEKTGVAGAAERKPKAKKSLDFGDAMTGDAGIEQAFRSLHQESAPSPVQPVKVADPAPVEVQDVKVSSPAKQKAAAKPVAKEVTPKPAKVVRPAPPSPTPAQEPIQTVSQSVIQTVNQPVGQTVSQPDSQLTSHSDGQSDSPSAAQTVIQPVFQPDGQTVGQSDRRSVRQSDVQTVGQPVIQTVGQTVSHNYPAADLIMFADPVQGLTRNQCLVLLYLIQQPGVTQRPAITQYTGVPLGTVKDALASIVKKGFISKPQYFVNGDYRGFSYVLNRPRCEDFLRKRGPEFGQTVNQTVVQTVSRTVGQTVVHPDSQSDGQTVPFSSSVLEEKTTTQPGKILTGGVGAYWKEEGLNEAQALHWCTEFDDPIAPEIMREQLEWARFDLEENGLRSRVTKGPVSWFHGVLRKKGGRYDRPENYKSAAQLRTEDRIKQLAAEKEAEAQLAIAEKELTFQKILSEPDSEEYQELFSRVDQFSRDMGGKALETGLREAFLNGGAD